MYLIDTNVVSEARKGDRANRGVVAFLTEPCRIRATSPFSSSVTIGELRRGVELIRRRGDADQAERLEAWLGSVVEQFGERILPSRRGRRSGLGPSQGPRSRPRARQADRRDRARQRPHAGDPQCRGFPRAGGQAEESVRFRSSAANRGQAVPMAPRPSASTKVKRSNCAVHDATGKPPGTIECGMRARDPCFPGLTVVLLMIGPASSIETLILLSRGSG